MPKQKYQLVVRDYRTDYHSIEEATDEAAQKAACSLGGGHATRADLELTRLDGSRTKWRYIDREWVLCDAMKDHLRRIAREEEDLARMKRLYASAEVVVDHLRALGVPEPLAQPQDLDGLFYSIKWGFSRTNGKRSWDREVLATLGLELGGSEVVNRRWVSVPSDTLCWSVGGQLAGKPYFESDPSHGARVSRTGRTPVRDARVVLPPEALAVLRFCLEQIGPPKGCEYRYGLTPWPEDAFQAWAKENGQLVRKDETPRPRGKK